MPRLPVVSSREAIKALEHFGFQVYRQTGSHIHLWNEERNLVVTVPNHPELAKGTLISIITSGCRGREDPSPSGEGMNHAPPLCRKL
ncbi:type II toxin-antitoxin system HicA family toxin [Methanothrix sp.]|uniref:type II toxin-antitoxin system HicA family toxin n=1 Tax=Methanothrix sp. TaxID=90426 RepID=UPI003451142F